MQNKKIALVTGGTGGMGSAICKRLADDGYKVIAGYYSGGDHAKATRWLAEEAANGRDIDIQFGNFR